MLPRQYTPGASQGTRSHSSITSRPARDATPRRMIVTAGVVAFALREWSLWALLRVGPWGPPMRLVLGRESVSEAVERILDALLMWPDAATLVQMKSGWLEQQVHVWGSSEQGSAVSLMHSILLRANRDELQPHLLRQPVPSLHVQWVPVAAIEVGEWEIDPDARPGVLSALQALRSHIIHDPAVVARYLADMDRMSSPEVEKERWRKAQAAHSEEQATPSSAAKQQGQQGRVPASANSRNTMPLGLLKPPATGDGTFTMAEAHALYRALLAADEPYDSEEMQRRLLLSGVVEVLNEERPLRDWAGQQEVSPVYRYNG
ncbi:hypothetical protein ccbrp13_67730 [Ktedonobacteria bacterium brp13]|nr:hypothetical protein ccbrp13_67730 [Ktedonobacteria bacterium brp13]